MTITTAAARTAVRAANLAGKQVTVTYASGVQFSGTARWQTPSDPACRTLLLFGAPRIAGPYTSPAADLIGVPNRDNGVALGTGITNPTTGAAPKWMYLADALRTLITDIAVDQITAIVTTTAGSAALLPGTSENADPTLGTMLNPNGFRMPDSNWPYGSGLE